MDDGGGSDEEVEGEASFPFTLGLICSGEGSLDMTLSVIKRSIQLENKVSKECVYPFLDLSLQTLKRVLVLASFCRMD